MAGEITKRKRWVNEWNDSAACGTVENKLCVVSDQLVEALRQKSEGSNDDTEDSERVEEGVTRTDLSSESRSPEGPPPPPSKYGDTCEQQLFPPLAPAMVA